MEIAIAAILILVATGFVALPFVHPEEAQPESAIASTATILGEAEKTKNEAYAVIKEAELDLAMGKLSETDFQAIRGKYAAQALAAITTLRSREEAPKAGRASHRAKIAYCPRCGTAATQGGKFCAGCGLDLRALSEARGTDEPPGSTR